MHVSPNHIDTALAREGLIQILGSMVHRRPWFPGLEERAALVARALPAWAVASGITAGWVWTGMGRAEPWSVLREEKPGLSPLERTLWRARLRSPHHEVTQLGSLRLLTPQCSLREILLSADAIDGCATQVLLLSAHPHAQHSMGELRDVTRERRASATHRGHAQAVLARVEHLREHYPDITRYTS
jgi:hypothetical protein